MTRFSKASRVLLLVGLASIITSACDTPSFTSVEPPSDPGSRAVLYDDMDCPPQVYTWQCEPLNQQERDDLYWDLMQGIRWEEPGCSAVGFHIIDFIQYGDVRKFQDFDNVVTTGYWQKFSDGSERISFNSRIMGWRSERTATALHEGWHSHSRGGDESGAYSFENQCINW